MKGIKMTRGILSKIYHHARSFGFAALVFGALALVVGGIAFPASVHADSSEDICESIGGTYKAGECTTDGTTVQDAIETVINILSWIVGVVAVIMLIYGGFRYVTSGGDANSTKSARSTIIYSIVGLIVVLVSQSIVWFVLGNAAP